VQILPHVYLGNDATARNCFLLARHNIRYVINVTSNLPNYFEAPTPTLVGEGGGMDTTARSGSISYLRIPVDDGSGHDLANFFPGVWW